MKKVSLLAYAAIVLVLVLNFFFYKSLYKKQMNYIQKLLDYSGSDCGLGGGADELLLFQRPQ